MLVALASTGIISLTKSINQCHERICAIGAGARAGGAVVERSCLISADVASGCVFIDIVDKSKG
jgi:hypothetical protein